MIISKLPKGMSEPPIVMITKILNLTGGVGEKINIVADGLSDSVTLNSSGTGSYSLVLQEDETKVVTFTGELSNYTVRHSLKGSATQSIKVMPAKALYWYGNECTDLSGGWGFPPVVTIKSGRRIDSTYTYATSSAELKGQISRVKTANSIDLSSAAYSWKTYYTTPVASTYTKKAITLSNGDTLKIKYKGSIWNPFNSGVYNCDKSEFALNRFIVNWFSDIDFSTAKIADGTTTVTTNRIPAILNVFTPSYPPRNGETTILTATTSYTNYIVVSNLCHSLSVNTTDRWTNAGATFALQALWIE